jgi:SET domain-containing protein
MRRRRSRVFTSPTGKRLIRRPSGISGWGVYAGQPITKNSRIIHYAGEKISHAEAHVREERQVARGRIWCFTVHNRAVRDAAVGGNEARWINHACKPNCYVEIAGDVIWIRAARNIRRGEELTYDYNTGGGAGIECRCRAGCTHTL